MHAHPPEGRRHLTALALLAVLAPAAPAYAESEAVDALRRQVEALAAQNTAMQRTLERLANEVRDAQDAARAAHDALDEQRSAPPAVAVGAAPARDAALLSSGAPGAARLQLLDVSLDVVAAAGGSSAEDEQLVLLQGGDHDPRQRGFTLQNVELSLLGAVDPFLTGEAHLIYFLDPEGESRFELEEAFVTSQSLPFGLAEHGLQLEAGHFFTEFGRLNPRHPHAWHWQDQPVILSRLFGEDGLRAPGVRLAWLTPLPWFSELHLGLQNASGETAVSFLANDEVFEERPVGGRPFTDRRASSFADLLQLVRWVNALDLSDTWSGQLGLSFLHGPNATGPDARSFVYGADLVVKWRPLRGDRGWPFVVFESELVRRSYQADAWLGCPVEEGTAGCPVAAALLPEDVLRDWGGYAQLLWGFRRGWAAGLRYEYATGSGSGVSFDDDAEAFVSVSREEDPFRSDRHRIAPLLAFHPSEYSRLRLQYNYDRADFLEKNDAHSLWAGIEFLFGSHPAHGY